MPPDGDTGDKEDRREKPRNTKSYVDTFHRETSRIYSDARNKARPRPQLATACREIVALNQRTRAIEGEPTADDDCDDNDYDPHAPFAERQR